MAATVTWLIGFLSMGIGAALLSLQSASHVALTVLSKY